MELVGVEMASERERRRSVERMAEEVVGVF